MKNTQTKGKACSGSKPSKTLLDFFKPTTSRSGESSQATATLPLVIKVSCPGCSELVSEARINWHLDQDCSSRSAKSCKKKRKKRSTVKQTTKNKSYDREKTIEKPKRKKGILSESDDDFYDDPGFDSPVLFDLPEDNCVSDSNTSQLGVLINASMVETQLVEYDNSPVFGNDTPRINVKSDSALLVESMLKDDWDLNEEESSSFRSGKRKTFDLYSIQSPSVLHNAHINCPSVSTKENGNTASDYTTDVTNVKSEIYNHFDTDMKLDPEIHSTSSINGNLSWPQLNTFAESSTNNCTDSSSSDDFEPISQSFRTPIKQKRQLSNRSLSKSSSSCENTPSRQKTQFKVSSKAATYNKDLSPKRPNQHSANKTIIQYDEGTKSQSNVCQKLTEQQPTFKAEIGPENPIKGEVDFELPNIDINDCSDTDTNDLYSPFSSPGLVCPNRTPSPSPCKSEILIKENFVANVSTVNSPNAFDKLINAAQMISSGVASCKKKKNGFQCSPSKTNKMSPAAVLARDNIMLSPSIRHNMSKFGLSPNSSSNSRQSSTKKKMQKSSNNEVCTIKTACKKLFQISDVTGNYKDHSSPVSRNSQSLVDNTVNENISSSNVHDLPTNSPVTTPLKLRNHTLSNSHTLDSLKTPITSTDEILSPSSCINQSSVTLVTNSVVTETCITLNLLPLNSSQNRATISPVHSAGRPSPSKALGKATSPSKVSPVKGNPEEYRDHTGYYLDNFLTVLDTVCTSPADLKLFNTEDQEIIATFHGLSLAAKKLYVRLFQRNVKWKRVAKIEYLDICDKEDTILYVNELSYANYLHLEDELDDVQDVLSLLSAEEISALSKNMKISTGGRNKGDLIEALLRNSKAQPTIAQAFCRADAAGGQTLLLKRSKRLLGPCCLVNRSVRRILLRLFTLYALPCYADDDETGQQQQLVKLLRVHMGQVKYPSGVTRNREKDIFRTRDDLIVLEQCQELFGAVKEHLEAQRWEKALGVCAEADALHDRLMADEATVSHETSLPSFLRRYTPLSALVYLKSCQVEALQRLRRYSEAIKVLRFLLSQSYHLQDYRGAWYDRLALNLDQHLKMHAKALEVVCRGMRDPEVRVGYRLALSIRGQRLSALTERKRGKGASQREESTDEELGGGGGGGGGGDVQFMSPREAPRIIIEGRSFQITTGSGFRRVFIRGDSACHSGVGDVVACSVEELVMGHYADTGYPQGLHAEGITVNSLFGLLFWSCLYCSDVPDSFRLVHQSVPLDLDYPNFYQARQRHIDQRVAAVSVMTDAEVAEAVGAVWEQHSGEHSLINWDMLKSPEHATGLILSLGVSVVSKICDRLAKDHRFTRSGFPDLIVWNADNKTHRIVEVKGPNDRLSTKQILWLDYLLQAGAQAEVCHVEAIGAKKMVSNSARRLSPANKYQVLADDMSSNVLESVDGSQVKTSDTDSGGNNRGRGNRGKTRGSKSRGRSKPSQPEPDAAIKKRRMDDGSDEEFFDECSQQIDKKRKKFSVT